MIIFIVTNTQSTVQFLFVKKLRSKLRVSHETRLTSLAQGPKNSSLVVLGLELNNNLTSSPVRHHCPIHASRYCIGLKVKGKKVILCLFCLKYQDWESTKKENRNFQQEWGFFLMLSGVLSKDTIAILFPHTEKVLNLLDCPQTQCLQNPLWLQWISTNSAVV